MHSVGAAGEGNIAARIDKNAGLGVPANCLYCRVSQLFQFMRGKIFFAYLNVIKAGGRGFRDFVQQEAAASNLVAGKLRAIGDVVKEHGQRRRESPSSIVRG